MALGLSKAILLEVKADFVKNMEVGVLVHLKDTLKGEGLLTLSDTEKIDGKTDRSDKVGALVDAIAESNNPQAYCAFVRVLKTTATLLYDNYLEPIEKRHPEAKTTLGATAPPTGSGQPTAAYGAQPPAPNYGQPPAWTAPAHPPSGNYGYPQQSYQWYGGQPAPGAPYGQYPAQPGQFQPNPGAYGTGYGQPRFAPYGQPQTQPGQFPSPAAPVGNPQNNSPEFNIQITERDASKIAEVIGALHKLHTLYEELGLKNRDILGAEAQAKTDNLTMKAREVLLVWRQKKGRKATRKVILDTLEEDYSNEAAELRDVFLVKATGQ